MFKDLRRESERRLLGHIQSESNTTEHPVLAFFIKTSAKATSRLMIYA